MPHRSDDVALLPPTVRDAVREHAGDLYEVRLCTRGRNNDVAALVNTADGHRFVKAARSERPQSWTQDREAAVNPYVLPHAPRLLHTARIGGWLVNTFEALEGTPADYRPGSPDLAPVVDLLTQRATIPAPQELALPTMAGRLSAYSPHPQALDGNALLHTDLNPANVLITDHGARLVDWAWASRGAAWIDAAAWCVWLIAAGHSPGEAETRAAQTPAFAHAPTEAVTVFAEATARLWQSIARQYPTRFHRPVAAAATAWSTFRSTGWTHRANVVAI